MCETCGCGDPNLVPLEIQDSILSDNDRLARHNREHFAAQGIMTINLMGSPGSGKTSILEATARRIERRNVLAISGDLVTDLDAARLRAAGITSIPVSTGSACHLDATVHRAIHDHAGASPEPLFIENAGNLVCPAVYDLGQTANVVALSVTEGEDKPLKYTVMFHKAELVLLTKMDPLPHLEVRVAAIEDALKRVMPVPRLIPVSARTGEGIDLWSEWLHDHRTIVDGVASRPRAREG